MKYNYKDKVVWITGSASGIGRETAILFAKHGARLIISDRDEEGLNKLAAEISTIGADVKQLPFDLIEVDSFPAIVTEAINAFGRIHILYNNGGISQRGLAHETSIDLVRKIMEIDFFSNITLTKLILPHMIEHKEGHIAVTSSIAGIFGFWRRSAYSAAKHAIYGFYESLRLEMLEHNVNVTIISPGKVQTNISVNAVLADGSTHGKMDAGQAKGITVEKCAQQILKALAKNKPEALIGAGELKAVYIRRIFPKLFYKIVPKIKDE